jgi:hypothetical protein
MGEKTILKGISRKKWAVPLAAGLILAVRAAAAWFWLGKKTAEHGDYSNLSWTESFAKMDRQLAREYAFTDWKGIDWNSLYNTYGPQVRKPRPTMILRPITWLSAAFWRRSRTAM